MMSQFNLKSIYLITHNFANSSFFCKVTCITRLSVYMDYFPVISHCIRTWSLFEQIHVVNLCLPEILLVRFGWNWSNSSFREKMKMWIVYNDTDFDDDHRHRTKPIWAFDSAWLKHQNVKSPGVNPYSKLNMQLYNIQKYDNISSLFQSNGKKLSTNESHNGMTDRMA